VLPSEAENFPIDLEAMAVGMTIITTEGTGYAEVVGNADILVPPKDTATIRDAFSRLVSEPWLCRELGLAARERLEENFSWPTIARRYIDQYRNIGGTREEAEPPQGDLAG
jgi:glycosyltransferase involved in cell wall biosynthesis